LVLDGITVFVLEDDDDRGGITEASVDEVPGGVEGTEGTEGTTGEGTEGTTGEGTDGREITSCASCETNVCVKISILTSETDCSLV
jgi:hypothetical protein